MNSVVNTVIVTVNKFRQFEKVEWKKLVLAEIEATKYIIAGSAKEINEQ